MPDNNSMGLGYAIALLDELKLGGCRAVALETLKAAVLAQQTTNIASPKLLCELEEVLSLISYSIDGEKTFKARQKLNAVIAQLRAGC